MKEKDLRIANAICELHKIYKGVIKSFWKGYNGLCEQYEQAGEILNMPTVASGVDVDFIFNGRKYTVNTSGSIPSCPGMFTFEETMEKRAVESFLKENLKIMRFYE
jgi:hypothetical protein